MSTHVAHHFDDAQQQFDSANLGMWVFLVTEVMFFGGLFAGYTAYRFEYPAAFVAGSGRLDVVLGAVNTGVLLTSSLMMALAVHAAQTARRQQTVVYLLLTMALGMCFLGIKAHEYAEKFRHHEVPGRHFVFDATEDGEPATARSTRRQAEPPRLLSRLAMWSCSSATTLP